MYEILSQSKNLFQQAKRRQEKENLFLNKKAKIVWSYLMDKKTEEIVAGGGASGGKSSVGVNWLIEMCLDYPGTRWLMGRAILKTLKESTLKTFFEVAQRRGLVKEIDYKYNAMDGVITFLNSSEILLKDLAYKPSDPNYDELGSTEFTGAFVDECNQIEKKCWTIIKSRLRYKLDKYKLKSKILGTCNPAKNWVYTDFYKPMEKKEIEDYKVFVQMLAKDNPFCPGQYITTLERSDVYTRERLLYGNWEFDDDKAKLFNFDQLNDIFTNNFVSHGEKKITADIAMQGADLFVIFVWSGLRIIDAHIMEKSDALAVEEAIKEKAFQHEVARSKIVVDSDGVGNYLSSYLRGIKAFVNNSKALGGENFVNLKSQCYYKLASLIDKIYIENHVANIQIKKLGKTLKEVLIEELSAVKRKDPDKDTALAVTPKNKIKEIIGRSPDFSDTLMMGMLFELKVKKKIINRIKNTITRRA